MAQQFANQAQTVISIAYTAGDTSLNVVNGAVFPSSGNFTLAMGYPVQFYLVCTARSGNVLTVTTLGQEGTSTANLPVGAVVTQVITAGVMSGFKGDIVPTGGTAGQILKKNSSTDFDTNWVTIPPNSQGFYYSIPTLSMFSLLTNTSTITDTVSGISITGSANTAATYIRPSGMTTPWNIEIGLHYVIGQENYCNLNLYMRNGSAGAYVGFGLQSNTSVIHMVVQRFDSTGAYVSPNILDITEGAYWGTLFLKVRDDGVNRIYYIGADGVEWLQVYSEARGSTYAVDRGGFSITSSTNYSPCEKIFHYKEYNG